MRNAIVEQYLNGLIEYNLKWERRSSLAITEKDKKNLTPTDMGKIKKNKKWKKKKSQKNDRNEKAERWNEKGEKKKKKETFF